MAKITDPAGSGDGEPAYGPAPWAGPLVPLAGVVPAVTYVRRAAALPQAG